MAYLTARWPTLLAVSACAATVTLIVAGPVAADTGYGVVATIPLGECSSPSGVSVDPATNDIYVAGTCYSTGISTSGEVTEIDGATNQVTASLPLGEGRSPQGNLPRVSDVAVDPATDAVYETVSNGLSQVSVVDGATNALTATIPISAGGNNLTVDPTTDTVYATSGNNAVSVISGASDQVTATIPLSSSPGAIATDPATGTVYVGTSNAVSVISETTSQVTAIVPIDSAYSPARLGVDSSTHTAYLSASGTDLPPNGVVYVIGTTTGSGGGTSQAPAVTTTAASGITASRATLNGSVNPEGQSTTYRFDYGTTTSYGSSVPSPAGSAGAGTSAASESVILTGLQPSTAYHYRIEATNSTGTTYGSDQTFKTPRRR